MALKKLRGTARLKDAGLNGAHRTKVRLQMSDLSSSMKRTYQDLQPRPLEVLRGVCMSSIAYALQRFIRRCGKLCAPCRSLPLSPVFEPKRCNQAPSRLPPRGRPKAGNTKTAMKCCAALQSSKSMSSIALLSDLRAHRIASEVSETRRSRTKQRTSCLLILSCTATA